MYFAHLTKPGLAPEFLRDHILEGHQRGCLSRFCQRLLNLATLLEAFVLREISSGRHYQPERASVRFSPGLWFVDFVP
jgi:hypothetical protein